MNYLTAESCWVVLSDWSPPRFKSFSRSRYRLCWNVFQDRLPCVPGLPSVHQGCEDGPVRHHGTLGVLLRRHRDWMATNRVKEVHQRRQQLVEQVSGITREQLRVQGFLLAGLMKVAAERAYWPRASTCALWKAWRRRAFTSPPGKPQTQPTS